MTPTGCHGVRLHGDIGRWGSLDGPTLSHASITRGSVEDPAGEALWKQRASVGARVVERRLHRQGDRRFILTGNDGPRIAIDASENTVVVDGVESFLERQLIAAVALPLLLHEHGVVMLHGAALRSDDDAVLFCGPSGAGKSSALIALVDAGWAPLSEDVSVVSFDGDDALVWPGPPWVRVAHDAPGPRDATVVARGADKTAWSIERRLPTRPARLERVVLLDPPGGPAPSLSSVARGEAIAALFDHVVWLREPGARAEGVFGGLSALVSRVAVSRVRLPRSEHWRDELRAQIETRADTVEARDGHRP